jgi:RNA polymerase sigma-70 factor (ECF subfamily)
MTEAAPDFANQIRAIAERGDREAFGALFRHFAPRLKTLLIRGGASGASAEEIAQEAMLVVWRKAAQFDPEKASAATWIFTIGRNLRIDMVRRERHPDTLLTDLPEEADDAPSADQVLAAGERDGRVRAAMATLSIEQAQVVREAFFLDKPHSEIERHLGIPLGTIKSRLRLAMAKLRAALEDFA